KRSGKSTGVLLARYTAGGQRTRFPIEIAALTVTYRAVALRSVARAHVSTAALMPAEPHIRSPFPDGWHHNPSFSRSSGSGGRVHTVCRHTHAPVSDGPRARIQRD